MRSESYEGPSQLGPGERIDPASGRVYYSAAWLNGLHAVPDPLRLSDVRIVYPGGDPALDARLSLFKQIRVAASAEQEALDLAVQRLLEQER